MKVLSTWPNTVVAAGGRVVAQSTEANTVAAAGGRVVAQSTEEDGYTLITNDLTKTDQESGYKMITSTANNSQGTNSESHNYFVLEEKSKPKCLNYFC